MTQLFMLVGALFCTPDSPWNFGVVRQLLHFETVITTILGPIGLHVNLCLRWSTESEYYRGKLICGIIQYQSHCHFHIKMSPLPPWTMARRSPFLRLPNKESEQWHLDCILGHSVLSSPLLYGQKRLSLSTRCLDQLINGGTSILEDRDWREAFLLFAKTYNRVKRKRPLGVTMSETHHAFPENCQTHFD